VTVSLQTKVCLNRAQTKLEQKAEPTGRYYQPFPLDGIFLPTSAVYDFALYKTANCRSFQPLLFDPPSV
jgi:hypothetical protein